MINNVILLGRLTADPEMRTTQSGLIQAKFTLAVNRPYTNDEGERKADFINCVAWRKLAENIAKYCTKGMQVAVEGKLQVRDYDASDGTKRYVTEILVENCTFLSKNEPKAGDKEKDIVKTDDVDPFADFDNEVALSDDDLPF